MGASIMTKKNQIILFALLLNSLVMISIIVTNHIRKRAMATRMIAAA